MFDFAAAEQAEYDRRDSVGIRICDAIRALPEKNAETMAKAAYGVVRTMCAEGGDDPDYETFIKTPEESGNYLGGVPGVWLVCWESGPYMWALGACMSVSVEFGKLSEPHYGFDMTFYPAEDEA
jgi:hypothetical protein